MANLMLLLAGHGSLRRCAIRAMVRSPQMFARMLAVHVGEFKAALGWRILTS